MTGTRRLAAIVFVDMVGYTAASQEDEAGTLRRIREVNALLEPLLGQFGGRRIKSTGDGMLLEFESALKASQWAIEAQRRLHERNGQAVSTPTLLRIGIHLGDVEELDNDIFGDAVNIAARIEPLAEPGGVCISGEVYAQLRGKSTTRWELIPPKELKGIKHAVAVYRAGLPWEDSSENRPSPDRNRIAVLPFANFSPDAHDEYFADGLTEELITVLARIDQLRVIARTSVFPYKGTQKPLSQIGSELGVSSILEGSVRKAGDRIRVTAQLIDVSSQAHRWAETYDRTLEDIFAVQTDVAREVAKALQMRLGGAEESRLSPGPPLAGESYLAYLRGRTAMDASYSEASLREAQWQFERAISIDPRNAPACAALSQATHLMALFHRPKSRDQSEAAARELADRAIRLDPNLPDGHSALGLLLYDSCEWESAEREARLALSLNPSFSDARVWYSLMMQDQGRGEEAHGEMSLAFEADPRSRIVARLLTLLRLWLRRLDEAKAALDQVRVLDSEGREYHFFAARYELLRGNTDRALEESVLADTFPSEHGETGPSIGRVIILALAGHREEARSLLATIESKRDIERLTETLAYAYALLGELDECFRLLFKKLDSSGGLALHEFRLEPYAEPVRRDPRFQEILKRMKLAA